MDETSYLECDCCGDIGAYPLYYENGVGFYEDGQPLICGCHGQVCCDIDMLAYINAYYCECDYAMGVNNEQGNS